MLLCEERRSGQFLFSDSLFYVATIHIYDDLVQCVAFINQDVSVTNTVLNTYGPK